MGTSQPAWDAKYYKGEKLLKKIFKNTKWPLFLSSAGKKSGDPTGTKLCDPVHRFSEELVNRVFLYCKVFQSHYWDHISRRAIGFYSLEL